MKLILLILLFFLTGCVTKGSFNDTIYVDSIGIDYQDDNYVVYFHISNPTTLITQEQGAGNVEIKYSVASSIGDTIFRAISNIRKNTSFNLRLGLVKSMILTENVYNTKHIDEIYRYLKSTHEIFPTFKVFYTDSSIKDIFSISNPKATSPFFSLIGEDITNALLPNKNYSRFISEYFEKTLTLYVPILKLDKKLWNDEDKPITSLSIDGICALNKSNNQKVEANIKDYPGLLYLQSDKISNQTIEINIKNKFLIEFDYYNIDFDFNNGVIINITTVINLLNSQLDKQEVIVDIEKTILNDIKAVYEYFKANDIDILNIDDYLYRINETSINAPIFNVLITI